MTPLPQADVFLKVRRYRSNYAWWRDTSSCEDGFGLLTR